MTQFRTKTALFAMLTTIAPGGLSTSRVLAAVGNDYGVPAIAGSVKQLVPQGWRVAFTAEGDLNRDGRPDAALALISKKETEDPKTWDTPRLLVVALRGKDGKLRPVITTTKALLTHGDGGIFGDPLDGIKIEHGTLLIHYYGGSRDRWDVSDRYRLQGSDWDHIGNTDVYSDTLDPTYVETVDTNLLTGYSIHSFERGKQHYRRQFYTLQVGSAAHPPHLDGSGRAGDWPGPAIRLPLADSAAITSPETRSTPSAVVSGVTYGDNLYVSASVSGLPLDKDSVIRIITGKGKVVAPSQVVIRRAGAGWITQASFTLHSLGVKREKGDAGAARLLVESENGPSEIAPLTIEVAASAKGRVLFSTGLKSRSHNGIILFTPHPGLGRLGELTVGP